MAPTASPPIQVYLTPDDVAAAMADDARQGLTAHPKQLPPKWLYDPAGCDLFEQICELPEYYQTRTERAILGDRAGDIAALTGARTVVELGSGTSEKTALLLDALRDKGVLERFVGFDVAEPTLRSALTALAARYDGLAVEGVVGDFERHLAHIPAGEDRLVIFLGGTVGNLEPEARHLFLSSLGGVLRTGEWLLLGTDLVKDPARLVAAYDDAAGVTAAFDRNVLSVLNSALGADFDPDAFDHVAVWDSAQEWIEMRLRARSRHRVHVAAIDLTVGMEEGEHIRTEISAKFRPEGIEAELGAAGFAVREFWTDRAGDFAVTLAQRVGS